jgi:hypothetical protein
LAVRKQLRKCAELSLAEMLAPESPPGLGIALLVAFSKPLRRRGTPNSAGSGGLDGAIFFGAFGASRGGHRASAETARDGTIQTACSNPPAMRESIPFLKLEGQFDKPVS